MKRDWGPAIAKCVEEGACRMCGSCENVDPAHIIPRSRGGDMHPDGIIPLCRFHHTLYDSHALEILPRLTLVEQAHAVALVGVEEVRRRTTVERAA